MPRDGAAIIIRPTRLLRISAILSATSWTTKVTPWAAYGRVKTTGHPGAIGGWHTRGRARPYPVFALTDWVVRHSIQRSRPPVPKKNSLLVSMSGDSASGNSQPDKPAMLMSRPDRHMPSCASVTIVNMPSCRSVGCDLAVQSCVLRIHALVSNEIKSASNWHQSSPPKSASLHSDVGRPG